MVESGGELASPRVVDLEGFFTNSWPSNKNVRLIPATAFLNEHVDIVGNIVKNGTSDGKNSKRKQSQPEATVSHRDINGVTVLLDRIIPRNSRLTNDVSGCSETSTAIKGDPKHKNARASKRRTPTKDEDENGNKNKKIRSEVSFGRSRSTRSSSETDESEKDSESNMTYSVNKRGCRDMKGKKNKNYEIGASESSRVGESASGRHSESLELERTPNGDKVNSSNNETGILKDIVNQDGNSSMVLRPNRRYYWKRFFSESDSDETWDGSAKKNKNKKKQQRHKKSDMMNGNPKAKKLIDHNKENNNYDEVQKSKRGATKPSGKDGADDTNLPKEVKSSTKAIAKKTGEEKKTTRGRKKKLDTNDTTNEKPRTKARAKNNMDDDKEKDKSYEVPKINIGTTKSDKDKDGADDTNLPKEVKSSTKAIAKKTGEEKKTTRGRKKKLDTTNDSTNGKPRTKARAKKNMDDDKENDKDYELPKIYRGTTKNDKDGADDINLSKVTRSSTKAIAKKTREEKTTTKGRKKQAELQSREEVLKPEDCVITAKRGTLKYLEQREKLVKALAREAEEEDDFFCTKEFGRKTNIGELVLAGAQDDTLSVKTPQGKGHPKGDCVITPRTALLTEWGVTEQRSTVYTPTTSSPVDVVSLSEKKAIMGTVYHHLKSRGKRPRGFRKEANPNSSTLESIFQNAKKLTTTELPELPEIPEIPDLNDGDLSNDDYFNESDA